MQTVIISLVILILLSTILKLSFGKTLTILLIAAGTAVLTWAAWPLAAVQSKTQIADWLANPSLMADIAVLITLEVSMQMAFSVMTIAYQKNNSSAFKRILYHFLKYFPGILYFAVIFALLTTLIFALSGVSFSTISLGLALAVFVMLPLLAFLSKLILPDEQMRLELLFLINLLIALMGIIATVNGRTSMTAVNNVEWGSLAAVLTVVVVGACAGFIWRLVCFHFKEKK